MSLKKYCLCTACDDSYIKGLELLLKSLYMFNPDFDGDIIILDLGLSSLNKERLSQYTIQAVLHENYNDIINFVNKQNGYYTQSFKTIDCHRIKNYERIVYMDCDLVINGDIMELFESEQFSNGLWADIQRDFGFDEIFGKGFDRALMIYNSEYSNDVFYKKLLSNIQKILSYAETHLSQLHELDVEDDACMFEIKNVKQIPDKYCRLLDIDRIYEKLINKCIIETPLYKWWDDGEKLKSQFKTNSKLESWCDITSLINSKKENEIFMEYLKTRKIL